VTRRYAVVCIALLALAATVTAIARIEINDRQAWGLRLYGDMQRFQIDETAIGSSTSTGQDAAKHLQDCWTAAATYTRDAAAHPTYIPAGYPAQLTSKDCK
jgi:hypothetical protein